MKVQTKNERKKTIFPFFDKEETEKDEQGEEEEEEVEEEQEVEENDKETEEDDYQNLFQCLPQDNSIFDYDLFMEMVSYPHSL